MADHAGGRRSVVNPGTKLWRPTQKKIILIKRWGNSMKQNLLEIIQDTVWLHTDEFIFVWLYKNKNGRQNRSSGAKTELLRREGATT